MLRLASAPNRWLPDPPRLDAVLILRVNLSATAALDVWCCFSNTLRDLSPITER